VAAPKKSQGVVTRCTARQDGAWLVVTNTKLSGVSPVEIPEGRFVTIRDGLVEAQAR